MKRTHAFPSFLLILGLIYFSFFSLMPRSGTPASIPETEFSTERALIPITEMSKAPHYHGSLEHKRVGEYLIGQLKALGLETQIQEDFVLNHKHRSLDKPKNIIGRIKGSGNGKSLVLLSHYDSALTPSFGASDAASGVSTILESVRAYLAGNKTPVNDIIVLFTDCEEIQLDGADLFVNKHPWAKDVGFLMNVEARGSGGPSVMILESNAGNSNLVKAFIEANPSYPVASSLMYSVYKRLPNNTDSTVFRENGDIDSFFFAFIDDHFDYHTANDTVENLDINTLQHQGSYLLPLLHYFAEADLDNLKSKEDDVYVNLPIIKMISYPFKWILPMLFLAVVLLLVLVLFGLKDKKLTIKGISKGFIPLLLSLAISALIGFYGWKLLEWIYPQYGEIQHGFKYNGHSYIAFFVFLTLAILFKFYGRFAKKEKVANLAVAPLVIWLLINIAIYLYLRGAAFFIVPVFFGLLSLWICLRQDKPSLLLMTLLAAPAIFIFSPLIQFFPVALGSEMVVIACIITVLLFGLMVPVFGFYKHQRFLSFSCSVIAVIFLISAHLKSDFSETRQKPNSLVYYEDSDTNMAYWVTYDNILDDWTKGYLGDTPESASKYIENAAGSKYNTAYKYAAEAPLKQLPQFLTERTKDTLIGESRFVTFTIKPQRNINQLRLYTDTDLKFQTLQFNGEEMPRDNSGFVRGNRQSKKLLRYYITDNDSLEVSYSIDKSAKVSFTIMESSFDLLTNSQFTINKRPKSTMPKPFVVTDAIEVKKTIFVDSMQIQVKDTITQTPLLNE